MTFITRNLANIAAILFGLTAIVAASVMFAAH